MDVVDAIQERWQQDEILGYDCVTFSDGRVVLLNCLDLGDRIIINPYAGSSVDQIVEYESEPWSSIQSYGSISIPQNGYELLFGEGAMGNEGFIACTNSGILNWSLFLTKYNPIQRGEILDESHAVFFSEYIKLIVNFKKPIEIDAYPI